MHTQIKNNKTKKIIRTALYTMIIAGAAGAATGTYAWYSYQKDVNLDFKGAAISSAGDEIEFGLRCPTAVLPAFETKYEKELELGQIEHQTGVTVGGVANQSIYWVHGRYITTVLTDFIEMSGYSDGTMAPITTGSWKESEQASWAGFKKTPKPFESAYVNSGDAEKDEYMKLPLAFRVLSTDENGDVSYDADKNIFLTKFETKDLTEDDDYSLSEALRCKVDYPETTDHSKDFVFDPNKDEATNVKVGGALNLERDIYYDYRYNAVTGDNEEIAYGEFNGNPLGTTWATGLSSSSKKLADCDTFTANHLMGVTTVDDTKAKTCQTRASAVSTVEDTGSEIVSTVDYNGKGIGFVDFSIYLEGWDKNVVDQTLAHSFSINIEFSVK